MAKRLLALIVALSFPGPARSQVTPGPALLDTMREAAALRERVAAEVGGAGVGRLIAELDSSVWTRRYSALAELGELGAGANGALPKVLSLLGDEHRGVRDLAALVSGRLGPPDPAHAAAFVALLEHRDSRVIGGALSALRALGPGVPGALGAVTALLRRDDPGVRASALGTLGELGPGARTAIPEVIRLLASEEAAQREQAESVLARLGPPDRSDMAALLALLSQQDERVRAAAERAVLTYGEAGRIAVEAARYERERLLQEGFWRCSARCQYRRAYSSESYARGYLRSMPVHGAVGFGRAQAETHAGEQCPPAGEPGAYTNYDGVVSEMVCSPERGSLRPRPRIP